MPAQGSGRSLSDLLGIVERANGVVEPDEEYVLRFRAFTIAFGLPAFVTHLGQGDTAANTSQQFASGERLHQIIISSRCQTFDTRILAGSRRKHYDGD